MLAIEVTLTKGFGALSVLPTLEAEDFDARESALESLLFSGVLAAATSLVELRRPVELRRRVTIAGAA